jgi:integrase
MASLCRHTNGSRYIKLSPGEAPAVAGRGARPKISLGKVTQKQALTAQGHIEHLCRAHKTGTAIPNTTAEWLESLGGTLRGRLETLGLVRPKSGLKVSGLKALCDDYIAFRQDVKPMTVKSYKQAKGYLVEYFKGGKAVSDVTPADAEKYAMWLTTTRKLSPTWAHKTFKVARQFFGWAVKHGYARENPFAGIQAGNDQPNAERQALVGHDVIADVLEACPDAEWRLIVSLARYGGIRIPSELLPLTWADVLWDQEKIRISSPKTAHHGKAERFIPLFPELVQPLLDCYDQTDPEREGGFVITRYRETNANLRTQFLRIIAKAGHTAWPKLFHNLRASRESELVEVYPVQTVTAWLGNTPSVALKHYLQPSPEHFRHAAETSVAGRGQNWEHKGDKIGDRANPQEAAGEGKSLAAIDVLPFVYAVKRLANKKDATHCESHLVRPRGVEPPPPKGDRHLKPARLPIPPRPRASSEHRRRVI